MTAILKSCKGVVYSQKWQKEVDFKGTRKWVFLWRFYLYRKKSVLCVPQNWLIPASTSDCWCRLFVGSRLEPTPAGTVCFDSNMIFNSAKYKMSFSKKKFLFQKLPTLYIVLPGQLAKIKFTATVGPILEPEIKK